MPSLNAGDLAGCLLHKLRATEVGGAHRRFRIYDDQGALVAQTSMSRGWRHSTTLTSGMVRDISSQLGLPRSTQLVELVQCTLTRDDYLGIASP